MWRLVPTWPSVRRGRAIAWQVFLDSCTLHNVQPCLWLVSEERFLEILAFAGARIWERTLALSWQLLLHSWTFAWYADLSLTCSGARNVWAFGPCWSSAFGPRIGIFSWFLYVLRSEDLSLTCAFWRRARAFGTLMVASSRLRGFAGCESLSRTYEWWRHG